MRRMRPDICCTDPDAQILRSRLVYRQTGADARKEKQRYTGGPLAGYRMSKAVQMPLMMDPDLWAAIKGAMRAEAEHKKADEKAKADTCSKK